MLEVAKAFGFTGFGIFLGLVYARHGWKKYYEGRRCREGGLASPTSGEDIYPQPRSRDAQRGGRTAK